MLIGSAVRAGRMRTARHRRARVGIGVTVVLAVASLQGCQSSTHAANATVPTTTGARQTPVDVAGYPAGLHLDRERVFISLVDMQYGDFTAAHWYMGFSAGASGETVHLEIDALAATADEATRYCTAIAGPAAFFMQGTSYELVIAGQVSVQSATSPGSVTYAPAKYAPVRCPKPAGALVDPIRATDPRNSNAAVGRFLHFLDKYYEGAGASESSWFAGYAYGGAGSKIAVDVRDETAAVGVTRCATLRPLAEWLLGRFAKQFTLQVAGMGRTAKKTWTAVNCP